MVMCLHQYADFSCGNYLVLTSAIATPFFHNPLHAKYNRENPG